MREIRFRAWDKNLKEMMDWEAIGKLLHTIYFDEWIKSGNVILMQYTDLKDKNGKEIYESDIVKNNWPDANGKFIGNNWVVKFGEHMAEGLDYYSNPAYGWYYENIDKTETYSLNNLYGDEEHDLEIIGNIYENPEMLETS